jgi:hypothetical protein
MCRGIKLPDMVDLPELSSLTVLEPPAKITRQHHLAIATRPKQVQSDQYPCFFLGMQMYPLWNHVETHTRIHTRNEHRCLRDHNMTIMTIIQGKEIAANRREFEL